MALQCVYDYGYNIRCKWRQEPDLTTAGFLLHFTFFTFFYIFYIFYIFLHSNIPTTGTWEKSRLLRPPSGPEPMIESPPS